MPRFPRSRLVLLEHVRVKDSDYSSYASVILQRGLVTLNFELQESVPLIV